MTNIVTTQQKDDYPTKNPLNEMRTRVYSQIDEIFNNTQAEVDEYIKEIKRAKQAALEAAARANKVDNSIKRKIEDGLKKYFGTGFNFRLTMDNSVTPSLESTADDKTNGNGYRYMIKFLEWNNGPNTHEVYYYLDENFKYYMPVTEFKQTMFRRNLAKIDKQHIEWFKPFPIKDREFKPIEIFKTLVIQKDFNTDKLIKQYFIIDAVDKKLAIENIRGETIEEALVNLQLAIENIYYAPRYDPRKEKLMQYQNIQTSTPEPDYTGEEVDDSEEQQDTEATTTIKNN